MTDLKFTRERDAWAMCIALNLEYPSYKFLAQKPARCRLWRIATVCRATNSFLQYAKR